MRLRLHGGESAWLPAGRRAIVKAHLGKHGASRSSICILRSDIFPRIVRICTGVFRTRILIQFDAELGGPLENMKKLSEGRNNSAAITVMACKIARKPYERSSQPRRGRRSAPAGNRNRKEHDHRQEIHRELLQRPGASIIIRRQRDSAIPTNTRIAEMSRPWNNSHAGTVCDLNAPMGNPNKYVT